MIKIIGLALVAVLWMVIVVPVIRAVVRFVRTTTSDDLRPVIRRVRIVSAQRAEMEPGRWVPINRWACKERL